MGKNEYFECLNCGQAVQGFEAAMQVECCDHPDYVAVEKAEETESETEE